jgi:ATP-dependent helicase YprA (DUF1998 family)
MVASFKKSQFLLVIVQILEDLGHAITHKELAQEINKRLESNFSADMIERVFLRANPGTFRLNLDGRWALTDWPEETLTTSATELSTSIPETIPIISRAIPLTPNQAFDHIKESAVQYLETVFRISDPAVYAERGEILRRVGSVAQEPFIESTPAFPTGRKLAELEKTYDFLPEGLSELMQYGVPIDRFALYCHQEEALLGAFSDRPSLLVASGTGSGKTEAFLLPILADILNEARNWPKTYDSSQRGEYNEKMRVWLHSRRHEARPAAMRGIVLYPMNALVNDQLSRLRRILARGDSPEWQTRNLNGNVIHFGMYTSLCPQAGLAQEEWRRNKLTEYYKSMEDDWTKLREELKETGFWPRPDSPEMLNRWDMQAAPPDILVTNYSMLEYMLVRPIEDPIFRKTRQWLESGDNNRLTLVLDEAHTYTGAAGTEVAHLVRRLKERLGLEPGSSKFRAIATTASLPNEASAADNLLAFVSDLFGEPSNRFTLITIGSPQASLPEREAKQKSLKAFGKFQKKFELANPIPAIEQLAKDLSLGEVNKGVHPQVALYSLLEKNEDITWVRQRTAQNATLLNQLAEETWPGLDIPEERQRATAGLLSAGSYARPDDSTDVPPLLSVRIHAFFRGIAGLWACMDPECSQVSASMRLPDRKRPFGKLYTEPCLWCDCGARVLEVFSCRHCGLLFLGGIPDQTGGSLWPWSDDLMGKRQDPKEFHIFGVELPHPNFDREDIQYRSIRTTIPVHQNDPTAREVYDVEPAKDRDSDKPVSNFPMKCPRCQNYRAPGADGREVIENLRSKAPQNFALIVEDGFRIQPRSSKGKMPNYGRKALLFSDSRQEAAKLAGDMNENHNLDLFRQLLIRALYSCPTCDGVGEIQEQLPFIIGEDLQFVSKECRQCHGSGRVNQPVPIDFKTLQHRVIELQIRLGINPTRNDVPDFFALLEKGDQDVYTKSEDYFNLALRRELAEDEYALEPLGLASWHVKTVGTGSFAPLTEEETRIFLRSVSRILATEKILLPPEPAAPWDWPKDKVRIFERRRIFWGERALRWDNIPYNLWATRKLGRYVIAVSRALVNAGRFRNNSEADQWLSKLRQPLWDALRGLKVLVPAGKKLENQQVPYGIRLDRFELHPVGAELHKCQACGYIMSETVLRVCLRCGQQTEIAQAASIKNFYRRSVQYLEPSSPFDDPYPLRTIEHTGQIPGIEARDYERRFQDLFHNDQNPLDKRVDVLSVTTTLEMGIDIGSLLCVAMRNIPPSATNYQQRAGRAGRRGSSIATVLAFANQRSHDQYYFTNPPEIVSRPPRIPALYISNSEIAHRHFRALVLQDFFYLHNPGANNGAGLFKVWGSIVDFANRQFADKLHQYLATNRAPLLKRASDIIHPNLHTELDKWLDTISTEVQQVVNSAQINGDLFEELISSGLLPKYAFPIDVVSLAIPSFENPYAAWGDMRPDDAMQRELQIALSEYAPGSQVVRMESSKTYIFTSAGLYDPYNKEPDYHPQGKLVECTACQSINLIPADATPSEHCEECGSPYVETFPYLRPAGFTVDSSLEHAGAEEYHGGGAERSGYVAPARLLVGQTSFKSGRSRSPFAPKLFTYTRVGDLFTCNRGKNPQHPGFMICPTCGRDLDPKDPQTHTYPADVPPHFGKNKGSRAGEPCSNRFDFQNMVLLGYKFHSEVILLGVDLLPALDASFFTPAGRAVWASFGQLVANAAAIYLQVEPDEIKVGVRAVKRAADRVHGEVYLYDDVPGGAGYARGIDQNIKPILELALELGSKCANPDCRGACYRCMFDYRNQYLHPILDRNLGSSVLRYLLKGRLPNITEEQASFYSVGLEEYTRATYSILDPIKVNGQFMPLVIQDRAGQKIGLWVIHPLQARPTPDQTQSILAQSGIRVAIHTSFDLERRPFWVLNNLLN